MLVVEDDPTVAEVLREVLQDEPYDLSFASTAEEAQQRIAQAFPDLILTDISLPGQSGLDVMRHARAIDGEVAVILMTGYASIQTAIDALREGADDYVTKPFGDITELPAVIEKRLLRRRLRAENRVLLAQLRRQNEILQRHEVELRERVERATWQLNALYRVSMEIGETLELEPRLKRMIETTAQLMGAPAAALYLLREDTGDYHAMAVSGATLVTNEPTHVLDGEGPVGLSAFKRSAVRQSAPEGQELVLPGVAERFRHLLAVPMAQGERVIGVLVALDRPEGFGEAEQDFLAMFALQAAVQVRNSQLYEHTKSLDRMKSDFVAAVSHETRTPLTSVKGALELLGDERYFQNNDQQTKLLTIAHANAERMLLLINDILDFSKLESASLSMAIERQRLEPVIEQAAHNLRLLIEERRIQLDIRLPADLPDVMVDAHRIAQVITNLLSNAIKFSPPNGRIEVSAASRPQGVYIEVRDHGDGIAPRDLPKLFQKFQQIDSSSTRRAGGTGLGLVISKGIVEQHGGQVGVTSELGQGSAFWFTVPAASAITTAAA
ncbi:MAG TPA: ATP-binding protein [Candidatus Acidoferrales bacterium]|nr:ATP-binding protein [Candidatus Acidoferrales bacterium]